MTHAEIVRLIQAGIDLGQRTWADIGAGTGNFTAALVELLGPDATLYAMDRNGYALRRLHQRLPSVHTIEADFTHPLPLPPLDGVLMANALHWVRHQTAALRQIATYLKPDGRLLVVEYDVHTPRDYIPFPVGADRLRQIVAEAGLSQPREIASRTSPSTGITMRAYVISRVRR